MFALISRHKLQNGSSLPKLAPTQSSPPLVHTALLTDLGNSISIYFNSCHRLARLHIWNRICSEIKYENFLKEAFERFFVIIYLKLLTISKVVTFWCPWPCFCVCLNIEVLKHEWYHVFTNFLGHIFSSSLFC